VRGLLRSVSIEQPAGRDGLTGGAVSFVSLEEGYARWAKSYDDDPNPLHALEERHLMGLLPQLHEKFVLDVGCGTGRWLRKLLMQGVAGVGIDLSREMLARGASRAVLQGRLIRGTCLALPFNSHIADIIICSLMINHVENLQALCGEIARVARPHADLFVTDFHPEAQSRGWRRRFRQGNQVLEIPNLPHAIHEIHEAFEAVGFENLQTLEPRLGASERDIFQARGKSNLFDTACAAPVIFISHYQLEHEPPRTRILS
jgi:ubiquinone/menaquinone biosynthesis C-methylase UbiE